MALTIKKWGISAGYGLLDIGTEYVDQTAKLAASGSFQNATDIQRAVATLGGAGLAYFSRSPSMEELGEVLTYSATPGLEKSLANAVLGLMGNPTRFSSRGQPILVRRPTGPAQPAQAGGSGGAGTFY